MSQLIQYGSNLAHLDSRAVAYTLQSIVNCFVLPWSNVSNAEQDFERRGLLLEEYIGRLGQDLIRLDHTLVNGQLDKVELFDRKSDNVLIFVICVADYKNHNY